MSSLLEALKKTGLVNEQIIEDVEARQLDKLRKAEQRSKIIISARAEIDNEELDKQEKFLKRAGKETTKAASRVGSKQYFDRFKK